MTFRLDRAAALATCGVFVIVAAVASSLAFWLSSSIAGVFAVFAVLVAVWYGIRPPVVLHLDADGYWSRMRFSSGRFAGAWRDVEDAEVANGQLVLTTSAGEKSFPLRFVGRQRVQVLAAFNDYLNEANGYRRWLG